MLCLSTLWCMGQDAIDKTTIPSVKLRRFCFFFNLYFMISKKLLSSIMIHSYLFLLKFTQGEKGKNNFQLHWLSSLPTVLIFLWSAIKANEEYISFRYPLRSCYEVYDIQMTFLMQSKTSFSLLDLNLFLVFMLYQFGCVSIHRLEIGIL